MHCGPGVRIRHDSKKFLSLWPKSSLRQAGGYKFQCVAFDCFDALFISFGFTMELLGCMMSWSS